MSASNTEIEQLQEELKNLADEVAQKRDEQYDCQFTDISNNVQPLIRINLKTRRTLKGHLSKIYDLSWNKYKILTVSQDGKAMLWDAISANKLQRVPLKTQWVQTCEYDPKGTQFACGGLDARITIYSLADQENIKVTANHDEHTGYISDIKWADEKTIVSSSGDKSCVIFDVEANTKIASMTEHMEDILSIDLDPAEQTFLSTGCDKTIRLWDIRQQKVVQTYYGHDADISYIKFFPSKRAFATASDDTTCKLFDLRHFDTEIMTYHHDSYKCAATCLEFSKSGRMMIAGYENYNCSLYDVLKGDRIGVLSGHDDKISCMGMNSEGIALATGSWDSFIKIWQ